MHTYYSDRLYKALQRGDVDTGQLIIAAPDLESKTFARTVVLIVDHSVTGTVGVILTERSELAVDTVMPEWLGLVAEPPAIYIGGPINQQAVVGLGYARVGVNLQDAAHVKRLANRLVQVDLRVEPEQVAGVLDRMRLFAGYCEWAPGQLDEEISQGDWYVAPALPADVVRSGRMDLWAAVLRRQEMPLPLLSTYPRRPADN